MKTLLTGLTLLTLALSSTYAVAEDNATAQEERVEHYAANIEEDPTKALSVLIKNTNVINKIISAEPLTASELEQIHEETYTLEAAVDLMRELELSTEQSASVDNVDEAVQALHYASEKHQEALTREWFTKLNASLKTLKDDFS
ncbi:MAG: hypothetical protein MK052_11615 [Alphaproteobacteria bacterium]|nr:hypothetical protein [Alphaproteobacteria bacterium]